MRKTVHASGVAGEAKRHRHAELVPRDGDLTSTKAVPHNGGEIEQVNPRHSRSVEGHVSRKQEFRG
jgi:hypothetical protein